MRPQKCTGQNRTGEFSAAGALEKSAMMVEQEYLRDRMKQAAQ
jgi:hypothetical protein